MALLPSESLYLGDRHPFDADVAERILHFLQLKWFNDRFDFLHI
jgi:hypothetical protein